MNTKPKVFIVVGSLSIIALLSAAAAAQNTAFGTGALSNNMTGIDNGAFGSTRSSPTPPAAITAPAE